MATTPQRQRRDPFYGFVFEGNDEVETVLKFLESLPKTLRYYFSHPGFKRLLEEKNNSSGITYKLFWDAFNEAEGIMINNIKILRATFKIDPDEKEIFRIKLKRIGFTGQSLIAKGTLYNGFGKWVRDAGRNTKDFLKKPVVSVGLRFLKLANKILGSLLEGVPGAGAFKEAKEIGETVLENAVELSSAEEHEPIKINIRNTPPQKPGKKKPVPNKGSADMDL